MRSEKTIVILTCDCCRKEEISKELGGPERAEGWLLVTITNSEGGNRLQRDIGPNCADIVTNTLRGGGPAFNKGVTVERDI